MIHLIRGAPAVVLQELAAALGRVAEVDVPLDRARDSTGRP